MNFRVKANALFAILGIAACSGKGGNNSGDGLVPPPNQGGGIDTPPSGYDIPPSSTDNPGSTEPPPPGRDDSPTGDACTRICTGLEEECEPGIPFNSCLEACKSLEACFGPCADSFGTYLDCLVRSEAFVCDADLEEIDNGGCNAPLVAAQTCVQVSLPTSDLEDCIDGGGGGGGTGGQGGDGGSQQGGTGPQGGTTPQGGTGNVAGTTAGSSAGGISGTTGSGGTGMGGTSGTATGGVGGV